MKTEPALFISIRLWASRFPSHVFGSWMLFVWLVSAASGANTFVGTGSLNTARLFHTATLLDNGKVLVVGGSSDTSGYVASAELYDPAAGTWAVTAALTVPRDSHTATLLNNGKVLVVGGSGSSGYLSGAELYDPAGGTWGPAGTLSTARASHTATLLANGKVLIVGGTGNAGDLRSAELFDPSGNGGAGSWSTTAAAATARSSHTATRLPNGKVLVAGGFNDPVYLTSAELYDPAANGGAGAWNSTGSLTTARHFHSETLLIDGKVLVTGGYNDTAGYLDSAERYDPIAATWSAAGTLGTPRSSHKATLLPNGKVLIAGGYNDISGYLVSAELYNPGAGTWSNTGFLANARNSHTATLLANGKALVAGGYAASGTLSGAELYDSASVAVTSPTFANVSATTAVLGGNVTSDGGVMVTGRGIVLAPTTANNNPLVGGAGVVNVTSTGTTGVFTVNVGSLAPGTAYTFRAYATNDAGVAYSYSPVGNFATQSGTNVSTLSSLILTPSSGTLTLLFASGTTDYTVTAAKVVSSIRLTPTATDGNATIKVNNVPVTSGSPSGPISLSVGSNSIVTVVTGQGGGITTYTVNVIRLSSIQTWRQTWYGTTVNAGNAADTADPYRTGIPNLVLFGLIGSNQDPSRAGGVQLPRSQVTGGNFLISITQPAGVSGITYGAEWSPTLAAGSWLPVIDTGSGNNHVFSVSVGNNARMFMRLKVTDSGP